MAVLGPLSSPLATRREGLAGPHLRPASLSDLAALETIERTCFRSDRISRRSFRSFLTRGHATLIVSEVAGDVVGYALVLFRRGTAMARLYSLAVLPAWRGHSLARLLLEAAEASAEAHDCAILRLEVHSDNHAAIALYEHRGYRRFGRFLDYYEDHADAIRYEKSLIVPRLSPHAPAYYAQTTDFTCGPAAMMMAMRALTDTLFRDTDLLLAQEYMPTAFDWRVGVLGGAPLFVCQYLMAKKHWQIVRHGADGKVHEGGFRTFAVEDAPPAVVDIGVRAARLMGDGLYGVDLKETERGVVVIEINDNPNLDSAVDGAVIKDQLWRRLIEWFMSRLER